MICVICAVMQIHQNNLCDLYSDLIRPTVGPLTALFFFCLGGVRMGSVGGPTRSSRRNRGRCSR